MAVLVGSRGTCLRRQVGCVLVNSRKHVLATGYVGTPAGFPHCEEIGCLREETESGMDLYKCRSVHAEMNALLQCRNVFEIDTAYITCSPCVICTRLLLNTSCQRIIFLEEYPQPEAKELWLTTFRHWIKYGPL
jgi:dCMP deaminase